MGKWNSSACRRSRSVRRQTRRLGLSWRRCTRWRIAFPGLNSTWAPYLVMTGSEVCDYEICYNRRRVVWWSKSEPLWNRCVTRGACCWVHHTTVTGCFVTVLLPAGLVDGSSVKEQTFIIFSHCEISVSWWETCVDSFWHAASDGAVALLSPAGCKSRYINTGGSWIHIHAVIKKNKTLCVIIGKIIQCIFISHSYIHW